MRVIQKGRELSGVEYYVAHLEIINPMLPERLSPRELEMLAHFMSYEDDIAKVDPFNTFIRKKVRESLKLSSGAMSNHIRSLISKGVIYEDKHREVLFIKEYLIPDKISQGYQFKIINK